MTELGLQGMKEAHHRGIFAAAALRFIDAGARQDGAMVFGGALGAAIRVMDQSGPTAVAGRLLWLGQTKRVRH